MRPSSPATAAADIQGLVDYVHERGFNFAPWQIAAYVTAIRTKPFVILAGVSGTGKSALPRLIADGSGGRILTVPVRPDWNDSSELLGFERLTKDYRTGHLLEFAAEATANPDVEYFLLLDEMNIARPEYYFAEVLSRIEEPGALAPGTVGTPLRPEASGTSPDGIDWNSVSLPPNLAIVGSVNMDETTFGFSRKVLDRAFVIEFSDIDLSLVGDVSAAPPAPQAWTSADWSRSSPTLAGHPNRGDAVVVRVISTLSELNAMLGEAQLQFGYRVRDEIAMFCLAAQASPGSFETPEGGQIDALDLAISMKVLPRVQGSGATLANLLEQLAEWAQPSASGAAAFPISAQRIALMRRRLAETGFTNYWT